MIDSGMVGFAPPFLTTSSRSRSNNGIKLSGNSGGGRAQVLRNGPVSITIFTRKAEVYRKPYLEKENNANPY
jgi:hypothetical protein